MNNVRSLQYADRKRVGDDHEERVTDELRRRGWTVDPYGQALLSEAAKRALQLTGSAMRWDPDMVATQGSTICLIDCKASMRGEDAHTYTISRKALRAHRQLAVAVDLPLYYVFSNLGVATPEEVMQFNRLSRLGDAGGYVTFGSGLCRPFDDTFGAVSIQAEVRQLPSAA